jgi:hypothetical protein|nr:MAG TPA: hypothetical protein [Caudoviricetes sp.]
MKASKALMSISSYPIPAPVIENIAGSAGLEPDIDVDLEVRQSDPFRRATAGVYQYLSEAPNVSQAGISYTFSEDERTRFAQRASNILASLGDSQEAEIEVGYMGEDF